MSASQGHFELSSCFGSVSLFSYKWYMNIWNLYWQKYEIWIFCLRWNAEQFLSFLSLFSRVEHDYGRPTVALTPRFTSSSRARHTSTENDACTSRREVRPGWNAILSRWFGDMLDFIRMINFCGSLWQWNEVCKQAACDKDVYEISFKGAVNAFL